MGTSLKTKPVKQKKCKQCKELYTPWSTTQQACSGKCAIALVTARNEKKFKARNRELKKQFKDKDRSYQRQRAQYWFNRYIRLRDAGQPCISCQRHHQGQYCAGHYRTRGAASHLSFNEDNVHLQCNRNCNLGLSGNIAEYRINLIKKIGLKKVEDLENDNQIRKFTIEEFKDIQATYKAKCKELESRSQRS